MKSKNKRVLWAGPEDGLQVYVEEGQFTVFIKDKTADNYWPRPTKERDYKPDPNLRGRYQWNSISQRFEWMGWE